MTDKEKNKVGIHADIDTPFGRKEFDTKKNTSKIAFPDGVDTRRAIPLRKKYRRQA